VGCGRSQSQAKTEHESVVLFFHYAVQVIDPNSGCIN
jgi:hypothetical protein